MSRTRLFAAAALLVLGASCTSPGEPVTSRPEDYLGAWRSTTAPHEHLRLTVSTIPTLSPQLQARLTFSGTEWLGPARIESDSLVMDVTTSSQSGAAMIAHPQPGGTLRVRIESDAAAPLTLTFVRED